jgi:hypothetical protein
MNPSLYLTRTPPSQRRYMAKGLKLGHILWRNCDKGAKYDTDDDAGFLHKAFVSWSTEAFRMIASAEIRVDY